MLRNGRHSQPWDTTRVARNVKRDTIQDSFAVLRPLLYRGRCRSVATVRRNLNVEILSLSHGQGPARPPGSTDLDPGIRLKFVWSLSASDRVEVFF